MTKLGIFEVIYAENTKLTHEFFRTLDNERSQCYHGCLPARGRDTLPLPKTRAGSESHTVLSKTQIPRSHPQSAEAESQGGGLDLLFK